MEREASEKKTEKFLWVFKYSVEKPAAEILEVIRSLPCVDEALVGQF